MNQKLKNTWELIKDTFKSYSNHDSGTMGAALSYYTIFSIAPVLVIIIAMVGLAFGEKAVNGEVYDRAKDMLGSKSAAELQDMIKASYQPGKGIFATIISIGILILGATSTLNQLQVSLDTIWDVKPKPKLGIMKYIRDRVLSFAFILSMGFLLLVTLVLNAGMAGLSKYLLSILPHLSVYLFRILEVVFSFAIISMLFCMMFKYIPDVKIRWREVWIGGMVTAALFTIGKYLISIYLAKADVASTFGAAGSVIILLVWVYYSSQILFIGAEFTRVYACRDGHVIEPSEYAVRIKSIDLEQKVDESHIEFEKRQQKVEDKKTATES